MRLFVGELKRRVGMRESHAYTCTVPAVSGRGEPVPFEGPVSVEATLFNAGEGIIAETRAAGSAKLRCSRCLEEFDLPISTEFRVEFRESAPTEDDSEEDVVPYSGDYVDLDEEIRQNLLLSLPMKPLCNSGCKGLCPKCGANLNRGECSCESSAPDPRLAGLEELRSRLRGRGGES